MRKCLSLLILASLALSLPAFATGPVRQVATNPDVPAGQRLESIVNQLHQVQEDEIQVNQLKQDFNRFLAYGGTTFVVSSVALAALIRAARYAETPPTGFMKWFAKPLTNQTVRKIGMPSSSVIAGGSLVVTGWELLHLQNQIDQASAVLAQEKADLVELAQSSVMR